MVGSLWLFIVLANRIDEQEPLKMDRWLLARLQHADHPGVPVGPRWLTEAIRDITALGSPVILFLGTMIVGGYLLIHRYIGTLRLFLIALIGGALLNWLLKLFFARQRPPVDSSWIYVSGTSFPSGHSMLSAVVFLSAAVMLCRLEKRRRVKIYLVASAMFCTLLVGASRVYLGVHYPSDVLAGWAAGLIWAVGCSFAARALQRRGVVETDVPEADEPDGRDDDALART